MLQVKELTLTHRKDLRTLAENFSFVVGDGDKAVVIGEEGNGKSTILKWIYDPGLVEGYCEWSGETVGDPGPMGYLAQDLSEEEKAGSVYSFCAASPHFFDLTPRELADIARQLRLPVEEFYSDRPVSSLSGGEKIKLQLGRLLFARPAALLLDEPSLGLAPLVVRDIFEIIKEIKEEGTTVVIVEQNALQTLKIADYGYVLEVGELSMSGEANVLIRDPKLVEAYLGG